VAHLNSSHLTANVGLLTIVPAMSGYAAAEDRLQMRGPARSTRAYATMTGTMIPIRFACAIVALAIIAAATPFGRSDAATNQVIEMPNGLKYTDTKTGDGATAAAGNKVSVHYTGWLFNNGAKGTKFDSSVDRGQPFQFTLGAHQVIAGWDEGVAGMKVGGKRTLTIPPELGYGARGAGGAIPPNSTLIFDVELLGVQ
jgi:FKBP-type peptidyl-prolyl cis-trans isomerase